MWLPWAIAAIASGVALVAFLRFDSPVLPRPSELVLSLEAEMSGIDRSAGFGTASMPAPSPDGRSIVV